MQIYLGSAAAAGGVLGAGPWGVVRERRPTHPGGCRCWVCGSLLKSLLVASSCVLSPSPVLCPLPNASVRDGAFKSGVYFCGRSACDVLGQLPTMLDGPTRLVVVDVNLTDSSEVAHIHCYL